MNHTMAQMQAMVVNEQDDWDMRLLYVEFAYNDSVSAATGLAPDGVHMGRLPRLPLTVFERTAVAGHQSLARDHMACCDLATDRQQRASDIVRKRHALTVFLAFTAEIPPSPTRFVRPLNSPWVVWHGCTTQLPPSSRA